MLDREYSLEEFLEWLTAETQKAGSQSKLAKSIGVNATEISAVLIKSNLPYPRLLRRLGWEKRTAKTHTFVRLEGIDG